MPTSGRRSSTEAIAARQQAALTAIPGRKNVRASPVRAACCLAAIASVLLRRPLVGILAAEFDGSAEWPSQWHRDPVWLRVYSLATLGWALVFGLRVAVQGALYLSDARLGWLAAARLAMGYPGTIVAVMLTVLYLRRPRRSEGVVAE